MVYWNDFSRYWLLSALADKRDSNHQQSLNIQSYIEDLNETTVINTTVVLEVLNRFSGSSDELVELHHNLHRENLVIQLTEKDYLESLEINGWYGNSINYNDCTIIHTMINMGIDRIVSFDEGFRRVGKYRVIHDV